MSVAGHHLPIWFDEAVGPAEGEVPVWNPATSRFESTAVVDAIPSGTYAKPATSGTLAARPAATVIGQRYLATNTGGGTQYESLDGSTWTTMTVGITEPVKVSGNQTATGIKSFETVRIKSGPSVDVTHPDFGCTGNASDNQAEGLQAAINTLTNGGEVLLPIPPGQLGIYTTNTALNIPTSGITFRSTGRAKAKLRAGSTNHLFDLSNGTKINCSFIEVGLWCPAIAGHVFNVGASNVSFFTWERCYFLQENTAKSVFDMDGGTYIDNLVLNCEMQGVSGHSVPLWKILSPGACNTNVWQRMRCTYSGDYVFHLENTLASNYLTDNTIRDINFEITNGGNIRLLGGKSNTIENCNTYDLQLVGATTKDLYLLTAGSGLPTSRFNAFKACNRRGGSLGSGLNDIKIIAGSGAGTNLIERCNGTIDLGGTAATLLSMPYGDTPACTILNRGANTQEMSIQLGFNGKAVTAGSTGWVAPTGTATKSTFDTATVTTAQLAERVKALLDYLILRGDVGA